ncbi:hypothetical protein BKP45_13960 [Anaerobacillus alkalidiazotrophicus]|uniref:Glycoside hydrolase family 3 C-terminal domain-containing protein n=1 Tax=Anaerobacillus alkalidiazotrophicus TaxID=472963 RepID=A0A1S2M3I8_9BACI|nr:hypothetical protein [Anaerobacillus alkalidiazotrophicus]OIJ19258.1 hypothetical protein BKP45_13960 [Anaerobacillus alkalidiazotrophicus]
MHEDFPGIPEEDPEKVIYEEDIFMGYRYFSTLDVEPTYEFGYGLSYTTFHFPKVKVKKIKDKVRFLLQLKIVEICLVEKWYKFTSPLLTIN